MEIVKDHGDWLAEYKALRENAGVLDLSFRSRICLVGNDRVRFLHGQVTNDVKKLSVGEGCYAAITTAKGKMESDLNIFNLPDELLLDFEPGLTEKIARRLEKFIVADDVQIVDAAPHYGLLSVQGPEAENVVRSLNLFPEIPAQQLGSVKISDAAFGEIYLANNSRLLNFCRSRGNETQIEKKSKTPHGISYNSGFDLFVPNNSLVAVADKLITAAKSFDGRAAGWMAFEIARIENGIPRFGADMNETNLPLECGIENRAISFNKGCYIGQEIINRVHSFGHVTRELRGLRLADDLKILPQKNDKLFRDGKEIGCITSAVKSPVLNANIALGYVRREANQIGNELKLRTATGESSARIVELPFVK
ncbi:MAG: YgfZ/GcvT domain-containing protein [Limisphaerales bacterium]